jgi:hypothetical protein
VADERKPVVIPLASSQSLTFKHTITGSSR